MIKAGKVGDPDSNWVKMAQEGNQVGLRSLYDKYVDAIYRYCFWQTHSPEDAQDITQDVFIAMTTSLPSFRGDATFKNWLYQLAKYHIAHWIRKKQKKPQTALLETLIESEEWIDPENEAYKQECVHKMLATLSPLERKIITLRYLRGYTITEAAKKLKLSESNIKVTAHRALKKLEKLSLNEIDL